MRPMPGIPNDIPSFLVDGVHTESVEGELSLVAHDRNDKSIVAFSLLSSAHLLLSKTLKSYIEELDPEVRELIADCVTAPTKRVDVSIYDPRVFELAKRKMVKIHERKEAEDGPDQYKYQLELEDWIYNFLKELDIDILRVKRRGDEYVYSDV